jgi:N,N'-diacetyllegionaminate synthase
MHTLVIAEAGVNHNGDIKLAKRLIEAASAAGADLVKFQTFSADRQVTKYATKAPYQILAGTPTETQHAMLKKLELSKAMHVDLIAHCKVANIGFFSTGFDIESIDMLVSLGQEFFKIPSGEITNLPYLRHIGEFGKRIILSTGMSEMHEIEDALNALEEAGTPRSKITVLQCTTAYPLPMSDVNLLAMKSIAERCKVAVGYSDHTRGIEIPIAAVALGASVIEKHFTLDRNLPGPDHKASLEPEELQSMVQSIRNIELALGDGNKRIMPSELANRGIARKSIVTSQAVYAGEVFTTDNLTTKRPGTGVSPREWDKFLGQKAHRDYLIDELIDEA